MNTNDVAKKDREKTEHKAQQDKSSEFSEISRLKRN